MAALNQIVARRALQADEQTTWPPLRLRVRPPCETLLHTLERAVREETGWTLL